MTLNSRLSLSISPPRTPQTQPLYPKSPSYTNTPPYPNMANSPNPSTYSNPPTHSNQSPYVPTPTTPHLNTPTPTKFSSGTNRQTTPADSTTELPASGSHPVIYIPPLPPPSKKFPCSIPECPYQYHQSANKQRVHEYKDHGIQHPSLHYCQLPVCKGKRVCFPTIVGLNGHMKRHIENAVKSKANEERANGGPPGRSRRVGGV